MKKLLFAALMLASLSVQARDPKVIREFRKLNPCPATSKTTGACPDWVVDHGIPLCAGGADKAYNLHWQKEADSYLKDADEHRLCAKMKKAGLVATSTSTD